MKTLYLAFWIILVSALAARADVLEKPYGGHFVGDAIVDETGSARNTCIRVIQGGRIAWFGADTYRSLDKDIVAELTAGDSFGYEGEDGDATYFKQSCSVMSFETGKVPPVKSGRYRAIFRVNNQLIIADGVSTQEKDKLWVTINLEEKK